MPKWHRRRSVRLALVGAVVVTGVLLGPRERFEERWLTAVFWEDPESRMAAAEAAIPNLRAGDQREVVWADPESRERTAVALVYLHGFSADRHEVEPLVSRVGAELGANIFFARLRGHGRDESAMAEAHVEHWLDHTAAAFAWGRQIGERVVLIGTSTGGTLAAWAASREEVEDDLAALVLISPNFAPKDRTSRVLLWPWGGLVARLVTGPERCFAPLNDQQAAHWTTCYPTEALLPMMALVEHVRTMDLTGVDAPTLVIYSPDDQVVDPGETERVMAGMTGAAVEAVQYRGSGDPDHHVLAGDIMSPGSTDEIARRVLEFLAPIVGDDSPEGPASGAGPGEEGR